MSEPVVVDARGQRCPVPIIRIAAATRSAAPGAVLVLLASDPATGPDLAAWCRMRGHALVSSVAQGDGVNAYEVVLGQAGGGPGPLGAGRPGPQMA